MSNLNTNRINTVLTPEQETKLNEAYTTIETVMKDVFRSLTPRERQTIPKISRANDLFVQDAITALEQTPEIFPRSFRVQDILNDYKLFKQLTAHERRLASIHEKFSDTRMLAGSESYVSALFVYRAVGNAADSGEQGIQSVYRTLRQRFDLAGNDTTTEDTGSNAPATPAAAGA